MDAEKVVLTIEAQTEQADRALNRHAQTAERALGTVEKSARETERAIRSTSVVVVDNSGRIANAQRNIGRQIADVGAQLSGGQSPFLILAQQAPQVADAMTDLGGKAGKVAAFFSGPWGAALLAAGSVLGVVVSGLLEGGDESEKMAKKLEDNAKKTLVASDAQATFEATLYGAAEASLKLRERLEDQNRTQLQVAQSALAAAAALRQQNIQNLKTEASRVAIARRTAENAADPSNFVQGGAVMGSSGFGQSLAQARAKDQLTKALKDEAVARKAVADAEKAEIEAKIPLIDMRAAAASDESAAAALRHETALGKLRDEFRRTGDESAYLAGRTKIENQLSSETEAIKDREKNARKRASESKREEAKAAREAAKAARELEQAQRELQQTLERVVGRFDPVRSIAIETGKAMADIDKLRLEGVISAVDALGYKLTLARDQAQAVADAMWKAQEQRWLDVGITKDDMSGKTVQDSIDREVTQRQEANDRVAADFRQKQEAQIRTLATIFEDGFRGGTKAIWSDFKSMGLRILAEMIARWAVMKASGQSTGSAGDLFAAAAQSVLGFAGGGYTGSGGRNQVAGVVHKGEYVFDAGATSRIGVGNLAAMRNGAVPRTMARSDTQVVTVVVQEGDLFQAKVAGISRQVATPIAQQSAMQSAVAVGQALNKAMPGRLAQFQRDGT